MSRIGRMPVPVPAGVTVAINDRQVTVKGPRGQLQREFHPEMAIAEQDGVLVVTRPSDSSTHRSLHGLTRALLANMVEGVSNGYSKELVIEGVGYRADMQDKNLVLSLGLSHPVVVAPPEGITFEVARGNRNVMVQGIDKELVGEIAARIRRLRPPEPYKGRGIAYAGERIRRKAGKAGKVGAK